MRCGVVRPPREPEAERFGRPLRNRAVELLLQVGQELRLRHLEPGGIARLGDGPVQLEVRQAAHVVEVQRVGGVVGPGDVRVRPVRRPGQVVHRIRVRQPRWQPARCHRAVELRGTELEVVPPLRLGIEAERDNRQEVPGWAGVRKVEDVLRCQKALVGERGIAQAEHLERLGQSRRVPPR